MLIAQIAINNRLSQLRIPFRNWNFSLMIHLLSSNDHILNHIMLELTYHSFVCYDDMLEVFVTVEH